VPDLVKVSDRSLFLAVLLLCGAVAAAYFGPFLNNFFTYDDFGLLEHIMHGPKAVLLGYNYILRFVANAVWWPLFGLSGLNPFGYNLFSALLWLLNALLLYRFLRRLLGDSLPAALASIIFVATAIGADAVLWRAANSTLLNVTFYLLTLHAYVVFRQTGSARQWRLSLLYFLLAVLSKEESASLPLVVLLLEWLYFDGRADIRGVARRFACYSAIVAANVVMNYVVIYHVLQAQSELVKLSKFRPLHSLLSGWTVFFLNPDGRLAMNDPRIYLTALLIPLCFFLVKDRRLLILGLGWVFLSFLPQSLSNLSQFEPRYIFSSLSRHLYLPSIGAAIAYTSIFYGLRDRFSPRVAVTGAALFLLIYLPYNYRLLQVRGEQWRDDGEPVRRFLVAMKQAVTQFPPSTYILVNNAPTGRAYVQKSLRAFYRNTSITWIVDPNSFRPKPGDTSLLIDCHWMPDGNVTFDFYPFP
jgi:hypothetical protein